MVGIYIMHYALISALDILDVKNNFRSDRYSTWFGENYYWPWNTRTVETKLN